MDPASPFLVAGALALSAASTGLGVYSSVTQAQQANRSARQQKKAQTHAARIQEKQINEQAALEKEKTSRQAHQIRSTLRVAAGESGLGLGGTYEAVVRQADLDEAMNIEIIERNAALATQSAFSRIQPQAPRQNALLGGIMGGLGGLGTGLSIGAAGMSLNQSMASAPSTQSTIAGDLPFMDVGLPPAGGF